MKIIFSKKLKWVSGIIISVCLLVLILFHVIGCLFGGKYISAFSSLTEVNKYEVRSRLLMDAMNQIGVCNPENAAEVWANGLRKRSAALQYSVMSSELKEEYARQLEKTAPNWVTGMSSPWVEDYKITRAESLGENRRLFELMFSTATSTGPAYNYTAILTIAREEDFWRITKISMDEDLYPYTGFQPPK